MRQTDKQKKGKTEWRAKRQTDKMTAWQKEEQWDGKTDRMTKRQAEGPKDTDKQSIAKHAISFNWGIINALVLK